MDDAIIIGGGPAGLSAALVLGRCRRSVTLIDDARQRNRASASLNGYLTRDGVPPAEFLSLARAEAAGYGVRFVDATVDAAEPVPGGFAVRTAAPSAARFTARRLLLATGVRDILPDIPGLRDLYGVSVHHCPYCDGWQHRDRRIAAFGRGRRAVGLARALRTWTQHLLICTDGGRITPAERSVARRLGADLREERVARLEAAEGNLRRVHFVSGPPAECDALFFNTGQVQRSTLPRALGCDFKRDGGVKTNRRQGTCVPGVFLAGDAAKDVQFVIVAAAEGATAAVAMNAELQDEDLPPMPPDSPGPEGGVAATISSKGRGGIRTHG